MDPIGFAASIATLVHVINKTVLYLWDIKHAPVTREEIAREATGLLPILTRLRNQVEEAPCSDPLVQGLRSLGAKNGPIDQFTREMIELQRRVHPEGRAKTFGRMLLWTWEKKDIANILLKIEHCKSSIILVIGDDH